MKKEEAVSNRSDVVDNEADLSSYYQQIREEAEGEKWDFEDDKEEDGKLKSSLSHVSGA